MINDKYFNEWNSEDDLDVLEDGYVGFEILVRRKDPIFTYYNNGVLELNCGVGYVNCDEDGVYIVGCENITEDEFEWKLIDC